MRKTSILDTSNCTKQAHVRVCKENKAEIGIIKMIYPLKFCERSSKAVEGDWLEQLKSFGTSIFIIHIKGINILVQYIRQPNIHLTHGNMYM